MKRGRKISSPKNSRKKIIDDIKINDLVPTADLSPEAMDEFLRLARSLESQGRLDRSDTGLITRAAQFKALEDLAHKKAKSLDPDMVRVLASLSAKYATYLRALGITVLPSRTHVTTKAKNAPDDDKWGGKLKVAGY